MTEDLDARRNQALVIDGLRKYVRQPMLDSGFALDSCIAATRIALDVLDYFGIKAEPMPLAIFLMNEEAIQIAEAGGTLMDIKNETLKYTKEHVGGPWTIGLGAAGDTRPNRWAGHLVAAVPELQLLVDLSADQVARPHKGMPIEPMIWPVMDDDWWAGRELKSQSMAFSNDEEDGRRILVWFDRTDYGGDFEGYKRSTNWRRTSTFDRVETETAFRRITGDTIRQIKADIAQVRAAHGERA